MRPSGSATLGHRERSPQPSRLLKAPQGVYFVETSGPPFHPKVQLKLLDLASRRITELAALERPVDRGTSVIAVSGDGLHLLYTQIDRSGSDIMLVENFH
jgi:hypothetical protein